MARQKTSIHIERDLNAELKRANFMDFLEEWHGRRWGSIRAFAYERRLDARKVYRQLNGTDALSDELVKEMKAFVEDNS